MCNGGYFGWFGSLRIAFPNEMLKPIREAVFGFVGNLKDYMKDTAGNLMAKARSKIVKEGEQAENQPGMDNPPQRENN